MRQSGLLRTIAIAAALVLPYLAINAWSFIPSTIFLLWLCGPDQLGLRMRPASALVTLALGGLAFIVFRLLILDHTTLAGLQYDTSAWSPWLRTRPVLQCLVEEMVLRSLLLKALERRLPGNVMVSLGTAALFSLIHLPLYRVTNGAWIAWPALITLFGFGVVCNELFLRFRHVGFGYALHLGWNLTRFGGDYLSPEGVRLSEASTYRFIEGSPSLVAIAVAAAAMVLTANRLLRKSARNESRRSLAPPRLPES